jgi:hypothetical protein
MLRISREKTASMRAFARVSLCARVLALLRSR